MSDMRFNGTMPRFCYLHEEVAHKANVNLNNAIHMNQMRENARKQLTELADSLEERLGKRGPGATIVTLILKRNVEKMKLINEVLCGTHKRPQI
eukprot:1408434-Amphidinium_carterae.1